MRAKSITITAGQPSGMINGIMSLIQLTRLSMQQDTFIPVECWEIEDSPLYAWRGFMLDEARHFWGMRKVKQILDWMAFYKQISLASDRFSRLENRNKKISQTSSYWRNRELWRRIHLCTILHTRRNKRNCILCSRKKHTYHT